MTQINESGNGRFELEEESQKPKDIALAIFRFRARRGTGVYYALLSTMPVLVAVLSDFSEPANVILISVGLSVLGILYLARLAGMKRFYQMGSVMGLFERDQKKANRLSNMLGSARTVIATLLPLLASAVFVATGNPLLGSALLLVFVGYVLVYYIPFLRRHSPDSVLPLRLEDWLVALLAPALLLFYFFQAINETTYLVSLLLLFLFTGIKSSYEAPQTLVQVLNEKEGFSIEPLPHQRKQDEVNLSDVASGGALSSSARVGIMLALLGVEQITFTDLMFVVKVSKSSLNHSVNALADAGYVTVRKGFHTAGGPRTFIQITKKGKEAIHTYLENMQTIASKFLS